MNKRIKQTYRETDKQKTDELVDRERVNMCKYSLSNKMDIIAKYKTSIGQRQKGKTLETTQKETSIKQTYILQPVTQKRKKEQVTMKHKICH